VKSSGFSIEFWGILYCICDRYDIFLFIVTNWWRLYKYDLNYVNVFLLMLIKCLSLCKRMLWLIVLNVVLRFNKINREIYLRLDDKSRLFVILRRVVLVLWYGLNFDWKFLYILFFFKKEYNCEDIIFFSILDRKGRFEIGL